jgi:hypothetical protein
VHDTYGLNMAISNCLFSGWELAEIKEELSEKPLFGRLIEAYAISSKISLSNVNTS